MTGALASSCSVADLESVRISSFDAVLGGPVM